MKPKPMGNVALQGLTPFLLTPFTWGGLAAFETFSLIALYAFRPRVRSLVKDHGGATRMSVGSATVQ